MRNNYRLLHKHLVKELRAWVRRILKKQDDDDNQFNHPWAIF